MSSRYPLNEQFFLSSDAPDLDFSLSDYRLVSSKRRSLRISRAKGREERNEETERKIPPGSGAASGHRGSVKAEGFACVRSRQLVSRNKRSSAGEPSQQAQKKLKVTNSNSLLEREMIKAFPLTPAVWKRKGNEHQQCLEYSKALFSRLVELEEDMRVFKTDMREFKTQIEIIKTELKLTEEKLNQGR
jgi:hypothetical protein